MMTSAGRQMEEGRVMVGGCWARGLAGLSLLFVMLAGAGCGKEQPVTELPVITLRLAGENAESFRVQLVVDGVEKDLTERVPAELTYQCRELSCILTKGNEPGRIQFQVLVNGVGMAAAVLEQVGEETRFLWRDGRFQALPEGAK